MIPKFLKKICVQDCVYWGDPVYDGFGNRTFSTIKEMKCRWEETSEVIINRFGKEVMARSRILVTEDIMEEGYMYLGKLSDLDSNQINKPMEVPRAFIIQKYTKMPIIKSNKIFVITVYL